MKALIALLALSSLNAFASEELIKDMYFKKTKNGVEVNLEYRELLGIKAFLDIPTNVSFKPIVECENLGGYTFANVTLEPKYIRNPETSRFRGGQMVTSYTKIRLKTHKLCDGEPVDSISVNGKKVKSFGVKE